MRLTARIRFLVVAGAVVVVGAGVTTALAWTVPSDVGSARGQASALPAPGGLAAGLQASGVHLAWSAVTSSPVTGYQAYRYRGAAAAVPACSTTSTSCDDPDGASGDSYTVRALLQSWVGPESGRATVSGSVPALAPRVTGAQETPSASPSPSESTSPSPGSSTSGPPAPQDVQGSNGSGVSGQLDGGDTLRLTFTGTVAAGSLVPGWDGSARPVTVHVAPGVVGGNDQLTVWIGSTQVTVLGTVDLGHTGYVIGAAADVGATMTLSGAVVTITLDAPATTLGVVPDAGTLTWAIGSVTVTESGVADLDF